MTQELKPGEFVVHANGTVEGVLKFTKTSFKHSKEFLRESTWEVHEYVSHLIDDLGYTRVSTEGSAIKEVAPASTEKQRAPLTWNTKTPFDPFKGFVSFNLSPTDGMPWKREDCALTRMSEGTNPTHGSALLLKD